MLQNASLLAIVAVDTEENEPIKNQVWWVRRHFFLFAEILRSERCKGLQILSKSRKMLKIEYLVAKIIVDTDENEPSKV